MEVGSAVLPSAVDIAEPGVLNGGQNSTYAPKGEAMPDAVEPVDALLARRLGYAEADLVENREGVLSRRQRRRLVRRIALDALLWLLGGLAGTGVFVVPVVRALIDLVSGVPGDPGTLFVAGPFAALVVLALGAGIPDSRMVDLLDILRAQAPVQRTTGEVCADDTPQMMMGALTSLLPAGVDPARIPLGQYAIYHVDIPTRPSVLLSAERLPPDEPT
jgi:hypothetical protein